jgi:hypothetical protein
LKIRQVFWLVLYQLRILLHQLLFNLLRLSLLAIHAACSLQWHLKWIVFLRRHPLILLLKVLTLPGYAAATRRNLAHGLLLPRDYIGLDTLLFSDFEAIWD